jgi:hypothetical protein
LLTFLAHWFLSIWWCRRYVPRKSRFLWQMPSSWTLRSVALERTDVSEECVASIIRVTRVGELVTLAVTSNRVTLRTSQETHLLIST